MIESTNDFCQVQFLGDVRISTFSPVVAATAFQGQKFSGVGFYDGAAMEPGSLDETRPDGPMRACLIFVRPESIQILREALDDAEKWLRNQLAENSGNTKKGE